MLSLATSLLSIGGGKNNSDETAPKQVTPLAAVKNCSDDKICQDIISYI